MPSDLVRARRVLTQKEYEAFRIYRRGWDVGYRTVAKELAIHPSSAVGLVSNAYRKLEPLGIKKPLRPFDEMTDLSKLRGVPVVGVGSGAIRGTHPEAETLRRSR